MSSTRASVNFKSSLFTDVESFVSYEAIASSIVAQSVTSFAIGPIWSSDEP